MGSVENDGDLIPDVVPHRHDQMALSIIDELLTHASRMQEQYMEGRYNESYDELQTVMAAGAELLKGFGLQPDQTIVRQDYDLGGLAPMD